MHSLGGGGNGPAVAYGRRRQDRAVAPLFTRRTAQAILKAAVANVRLGIDTGALSPADGFSFRWDGDRVVGVGWPDPGYQFSVSQRKGRYALFPGRWRELWPPLPRHVPGAAVLLRRLMRPTPDRRPLVR